jgi:hypothetical protein
MTARPGRIGSIRQVDVPRTHVGSTEPLTPLEFRADPAFGKLALQLWEDLARPGAEEAS